jgi:tetratricopeptide (TPR) repeat protein
MGAPASGRSPVGPEGFGDVASLPAEDHRILAYASAIGSEFDFRLLVEAMGLDDEILAERLEGLVRRGLLVERPGGDRFGFVEEEFRARIYRSLTESRLRVLHRKIAEVLERISPTPGPEVFAELGRHYFLGKVPEKSYEFNRRAAELARAADQPDVAIHHLERALVDLANLGPDRTGERAEVAETLGELCYATANFPAADRYFAEALGLVQEGQPRIRARLLLARAEILRENLDNERAAAGAGEALRLFEGTDDRVGMAQAYRLLGRIAFQRGAYRDALDESMRALDALPKDADPRLRGRLAIDIGNAFASLGEEVRPVAIEFYERASEWLRPAHDWAELARGLHNLGVTVGEVRPAEGLEFLQRARDAAEQAHDARATGRALLSGVEMRLALGDLEEAERDNEQSGRLLERLADEFGLEQVVLNRGLIGERKGQWDDAERAYTTAARMAHEHQVAAIEAEATLYLARLRFKTRNADGARQAFDRATELKLKELSPRLAQTYDELGRELASDSSLPPQVPSHSSGGTEAGRHAGERPL